MKQPLVRNAADEAQVRDAKGKERRGRDQEIDDLGFVLGTSQGRRLIWRLLSKCGTFKSIWEPSAKIHFNAGQQDIGHFLMAEIVEADPNKLIEMMTENKKEQENG